MERAPKKEEVSKKAAALEDKSISRKDEKNQGKKKKNTIVQSLQDDPIVTGNLIIDRLIKLLGIG